MMKIKYNSPVILNFAFAAVIVKLVNDFLFPGITFKYFALLPGMEFSDPLTYLRFFTHILGHDSWQHLLGNFTFILLIGPMLEEKYGRRDMIIMILFTALSTGILNKFLFDSGLLGASGIAFMMILLASFTNIGSGSIPLTFILILILYLGGEISDSLKVDNISQFAHLLGGAIGTLFGFYHKR